MPEDPAPWENATGVISPAVDVSGNGGHSTTEADSGLSLDEAVARVPESTRRQLEELFRGRFIGVKRIKPGEIR